MTYKCIKRCTFKGRYWDPGQICDFGKETPPHHFVATTEEANTELPKPRLDIMSGKIVGVNARSFYEVAKQKTNTNVGFASTLDKDETIHDAKSLKVKK